jgi:hypothetical protein
MALVSQPYRWPPNGPFTLTVSLDNRDGRLVPVRLVIENDAGIALSEVRHLPWGVLIQRLSEDMRRRWGPLIRPHAPDVADALDAPGPSSGGRPVLYPESHWLDVATVYASADPGAPVKAVATHFVVSRSLARKWVERCRAKGLIPTG